MFENDFEMEGRAKMREDCYHFPAEDRAALAAETAYRMYQLYAKEQTVDADYRAGKRDAWAQTFGLLARPDDPRLVEVLDWSD